MNFELRIREPSAKGKDKSRGVRISDDLYRRITAMCNNLGLTFSELSRGLLEKELLDWEAKQ